jgi:transcription elongation factor Elf1
MDEDEEELVTEIFKCPVCGEHRLDWLKWVNDETLECATCHMRYWPTYSPLNGGPFSLN